MTSATDLRARNVLRRIFASYLSDVYDDPSDVDAEDLADLKVAGESLLIDIWNRESLRSCSVEPTDYEYARLEAIRDGREVPEP